MGDLLKSEHLNARGFFAHITHPEAGTLPYAGTPYQFSASPEPLLGPAPCLGQHNREIYGDLLGLSSEKIADLQQAHVI